MEARQDFTAFGPTNSPDLSSFNSAMFSLMSTQTAPASSGQVTQTATSTNPSRSSSTSSTGSSAATGAALSTVPASTAISASRSSAGTTGPTATNAALNASNGSLQSDTCNSISCSPRLQAAVAVPVAIGVVIVIALVIFLARRKRKTSNVPIGDEEKPKKEWSRHLRIFSFDNELIHGGRFSSSNITHNDGSSQRLTETARQRNDPSLHSIGSVAPPYRDTVDHVQPPNMTQTGSGVATGGLAAAAIPRSPSRASAPPPYGQPENQSLKTPAISVTAAPANPFSDDSPVEGSSPFDDPSEDGRSVRTRPMMSRNSSVQTGANVDANSTWYDSDAGSIREAQVGRHVSVTSGGRQINVRNSSQSPAESD